MSPQIRRHAQLFSLSSGVSAILLTLLFLTLTNQDTLHAASPQAPSTATVQTANITGQVTAKDSGAPLARRLFAEYSAALNKNAHYPH